MRNISIQELEEIKFKTLERVNQGTDRRTTRIVVGMATCGIAAGAKPVLDAINNAIEELELDNIVVTKTGCIGACKLEPIIEIIKPGEEKVTYVKITPYKARQIINEHVANGNIVEENTIHIINNKIINDFSIIDD
ncbi:(2Fe-2S) ferredoxin domain-containing protein [Clostridium aestuarii]|uniref:(2Fe-2S) ferredoxin domain-containing protein n=1 Tax=Clostridium aestuarii TaxID=338193 RepID=A0ABT4CWL3_9CLOT|nr:(2Fe-2S) ferredoxin domain-containing protein [Clostridium aestuarii]MCY6483401.1 (2Fe-2S) ferredoxin domain-containing protein [Clostridium aestuarii]